jgi:hypothetical protein
MHRGGFEAVKVTLDLEIGETTLPGRICRCGSKDFREVVFKVHQQRAQCADCGYQFGGSGYCGRIVRFVIGCDKEEIIRCGDFQSSSSVPADDSQTSIPLAICFDCHRLVTLQ